MSRQDPGKQDVAKVSPGSTKGAHTQGQHSHFHSNSHSHSNSNSQMQTQTQTQTHAHNGADGAAKGAARETSTAPRVDSVEDDVITYDCGHVLYAPPRKIDKRVVGILYER